MSYQDYGLDINDLGGSRFPRFTYETPPAYFTAIVEDIVLNESGGTVLKYATNGSNIGQALIRIIPQDKNVPLEKLKKAFPLETNIQAYPLKGEQVMVFKTMGGLYYTRPLATTRKVTENSWFSLRRFFRNVNTALRQDARALSNAGAGVGSTFASVSDDDVATNGKEFILNPTVRLPRANEGDVILQGRYGNVIRMGSSLFKSQGFPDANILLTAGMWEDPSEVSTPRKGPYSLVYENLDMDKSSIWMVANQEVPFTPATMLSSAEVKAHLLSSPRKTKKYDGAQIFLNSDRVILNSKINEISLFSKKEINLSSIGAITLDSESSIILRSLGTTSNVQITADNVLSLRAKKITIKADENLSYEVPGDYIIQGKRIFIGGYATGMEPLVLGNKLAGYLTTLVTNVNLLNAVVSRLLQPASFLVTVPGAPPVVLAATPTPATAALATQLGSIATTMSALLAGAKPTTAVFNSKDNFTLERNI